MRIGIIGNILALALAALQLAFGDWLGAVAIVGILATTDIGVIAFTRAGARARQAMREETRLHNRERPVGVTVDFDNSVSPVPCEIVADPEGDVDDNGNPLAWLARPLYVPEGAERIVSYHVGVWPSQHGITLQIEGLPQ